MAGGTGCAFRLELCGVTPCDFGRRNAPELVENAIQETFVPEALPTSAAGRAGRRHRA
jgi:hypothetical protein